MIGLTPRQADLLRFIAGYQEANGGRSPAVRKCATGIGASNVSHAFDLLCQLEERGAIRRDARPGCVGGTISIQRHIAIPRTATGEPLYAVSHPLTGRSNGQGA